MCFGGTKEHTIGNDAGAASAFYEHPQEERDEEKLGLFRAGRGAQAVADAFRVHRAFEGRVCEAEGEFVAYRVLFRDAVAVVYLRARDGMEHEVHRGDAEHRPVGVEAGEHGAVEALPLSGGHFVFILAAYIFRRGDEEARGAAGGVAYRVVGRRGGELDHHFAYVLRRAELPVLARGRKFAQHVLVEVAMHVEARKVVFV